jgi:hypothetical protein
VAARGVVKRTGQPCTIRSMRSSGLNRTRAATASPATRASAAMPSLTVTVMPGRLSTRFTPHADEGRSWAWMNASTTLRGERSQMPVESGTGQSAATPFSGSRKMLLANDEAARLGLPGRTTIVGSRSDRPSRKPFRV